MKRAVDIILVPPPNIFDFVLQQNERAVSLGTETIDLHRNYRFPHLSLLMGVLEEDRTNEVVSILKEIAKKTSPLVLSFPENKNTAIYTPNAAPLLALHEKILEQVDPLLTHDPKPGMYYNTDYTDMWVERFVSHHSKEYFEPHITMHAPESVQPNLPISGIFETIELCHLGAYNTCEKTLAAFPLTQS